MNSEEAWQLRAVLEGGSLCVINRLCVEVSVFGMSVHSVLLVACICWTVLHAWGSLRPPLIVEQSTVQ